MTKVTVCIDLEQERYEAYAREAKRKGMTVEAFVERYVGLLFREHDEHLREDEEDHPIDFG